VVAGAGLVSLRAISATSILIDRIGARAMNTAIGAASGDSASVPRLANGMKFRHDPVRDAWIVLGPERLFLPDEHAVAVLKLVDGKRCVAAIASVLAEAYDAPAAVIEADIWPMLHDLAASGAVRW
jgi:pyrroloquinoline quinone biosynthesis protein D